MSIDHLTLAVYQKIFLSIDQPTLAHKPAEPGWSMDSIRCLGGWSMDTFWLRTQSWRMVLRSSVTDQLILAGLWTLLGAVRPSVTNQQNLASQLTLSGYEQKRPYTS